MRSGIYYVLLFFYQLLRNGDSFIPLKIGQIDRRKRFKKRSDFDELWFSSLNYCNWYLMRNCRTGIIWWKRNVKKKYVSIWFVCFGYGSINLHGIRLSMVSFWWMNSSLVNDMHCTPVLHGLLIQSLWIQRICVCAARKCHLWKEKCQRLDQIVKEQGTQCKNMNRKNAQRSIPCWIILSAKSICWSINWQQCDWKHSLLDADE